MELHLALELPPVQLHRRHTWEAALLVGAEGLQAVGDVEGGHTKVLMPDRGD